MDLKFTAEDIAFRDRVRKWFDQNVPKSELKTHEEQRAWQRKLYEAGLIGMGWPREYGGQDARPMELAIVADEMARANAPFVVGGLGIGIVGPTIIHHGTPRQKERHLQNILSAEEVWCQLYSEPNAGSDLAALKTQAVDRGTHYEVNGQKIWVSFGFFSDWGLLLARTDLQAPKHQGISCFLIDMRQPGVEVKPLKQITGGEEFCEVFFNDARVEKDNLIGQLNGGWQIAQTTLGYERGAGVLSRRTTHMISLHRLIEVTKQLKKNGRSAFDDPLVRQRLGRAYVEIEVMRYGGLRILSRLEKGQRPGPESSIAKLYYSEFDKRYHEWIMEIMGPYGELTDGIPAELDEGADIAGHHGKWGLDFLQSRAPTIYAGTSEIQKNIIGERVLGLPKEVRVDRLRAKEAATDARG
jgi:alkylation response protein AidB-like acyl-CoA dehydrogenase